MKPQSITPLAPPFSVLRARHTTRMKHLAMSLALVGNLLGLALTDAIAAPEGYTDRSATTNKMKITIGSKTFTATLRDNRTVAALQAMLPLTLEMKELNGNEKYFHLVKDLPAHAANPGTIQAGDLMLYESNSLVLFYKTFATSYSYTALGRIDDPAGLAAAAGSGDVKMQFE